MNEIYKKAKGITLIALVVTIVVLLILATVTINMTLSNNGIFGKAKNATDTYKKAAANESATLNDLDDLIKGINSPVGKYKDTQAVVSSTQNTAIKDDSGNTVTVPAGFKIASDSATTQEDGQGPPSRGKEREGAMAHDNNQAHKWLRYAALAEELDMNPTDVETAADAVQAFIDRIATA